MSTYEAMGLRKPSKPEHSQRSANNKSHSRHRGYLKDMLVSKFLQKHKLEVLGPLNNATRDLELNIQAKVIKEFEKFMRLEELN